MLRQEYFYPLHHLDRQGKRFLLIGGNESQVHRTKAAPETKALVLRSCSFSGMVYPVS